ncbi:MAG: fibronectin type III domain-containing protein [Flavihumibacter sp.]|nr:fibronectin type III domain-containing protein [Flavihumibacter sp.]
MSDFSTSNRRGFITALAQLSALSAISLSPFKVLSAPLRDASVSIVTGPYLQAVSATSMSIRWITNTNSYGWVEYGETEALGNKAHAVTDGLVNAHTRIHEVVVSGLEPGRQYYYRIASKEILDFQPYKLMLFKPTGWC